MKVEAKLSRGSKGLTRVKKGGTKKREGGQCERGLFMYNVGVCVEVSLCNTVSCTMEIYNENHTKT